MSFIKKRGDDAAQAAVSEKPKYEKLLKSIKSGNTYKVRVASTKDFAQYDAHGVYVKGGAGIFTTPCVLGSDCPYCKAVDVLYKEAKAEDNEDKKNTANQLKKKERYLLGFVDLEDNSPMLLDFSKKQAKSLIETIKKAGDKKIKKYPFEVGKSGSEQATTVNISIIPDLDDLSDKEQKNFEDSIDFSFLDEHFEVLQEKTEYEALEDLKRFGFDISKIQSQKNVVEAEEESDDLFAGELGENF